MKFYLTGDCHGTFTRFGNMSEVNTDIFVGIICLGDFGVNFYLNKNDNKNKKWLCEKYPNFTFYVLRGNHEARPHDIPGMGLMSDPEIKGVVEVQAEYPNIRYLLDGDIYTFGNYRCLCIGGAYSVDKYYRLARGNFTEETNIPKKTGWFNNEQLTKEEMDLISSKIKGEKVDFVFTHTCPLSLQPTDLFLGFIDQSKVDSSMEKWMEDLKDTFSWKIWLFGHYHADRIERPYVEQYFHDIENLDTIFERWKKYNKTGELDWWLQKSPNFYMTQEAQ